MELQSKFIEGTNEQYSIRNDGVITRHYGISRHKTIYIKDKIITPFKSKDGLLINIRSLNNGRISVLLKTLVATHFKLPYKHLLREITALQIKFKDGDSQNCRYDNLYYALHPKDRGCKSEEERIALNHAHHKIYMKTAIRHTVTSCKKAYIAGLLEIPVANLSDELYELHKAIIMLKRLIKSKRKCQIQQS